MKTKLLETIKLPAVKAKLISGAEDVFNGYLSSSFDDFEKDTKALAATVEVREMTQDANFKQIFEELGDLDKLALTQGQIIEFCKNHKDKLRDDGYATFFLMKKDTDFFVAGVLFGDYGRLEVCVDAFSRDSVWRAGCQRRVLSLQLETKTPKKDSLTLETLDTLPKVLIINNVRYVKEESHE